MVQHSDIDHSAVTGAGIPPSAFGAKGRILVGTGAGTYDDLPVGTDGHILIADSGETTGIKWDANAGAADILDLPTTEMDDTLVLAPDGAGGVEFRAEAGGGGGPAGAVYLVDPAADPDADDDEGTGADTDPISGWTTLGTVTTLDRDTTYSDRIYIEVPGNANTRVDGIYKSHALADGEAFVARIDGDTLRSDYNRFGIFIGVASAAGRIDTMAVVSSSGNRQMEGLAMTNATSLSGGFGSPTTTPAAQGSPIYLAIRRNTSTSYDYLIGRLSPLGILWTTYTSARNPSFTQDVCGLFVNAQNAGTAVKAVFKWARFYAALPVGIAP
jgi:hypothetical protein